MLYLFAVGFEGKSLLRQTIVPVFAWIVVGLCFVVIVVTAGYGATEAYVRTEIAKGIAGVPREASPATNSPNSPQRSLQTESRTLQPDQIRLLLEELPKFKQYYTLLIIASTPNDLETFNVLIQYTPSRIPSFFLTQI